MEGTLRGCKSKLEMNMDEVRNETGKRSCLMKVARIELVMLVVDIDKKSREQKDYNQQDRPGGKSC